MERGKIERERYNVVSIVIEVKLDRKHPVVVPVLLCVCIYMHIYAYILSLYAYIYGQ